MAIIMDAEEYGKFRPSSLADGQGAIIARDDPNTHNGKAIYVALGRDEGGEQVVERLLTEEDQTELHVSAITEDDVDAITSGGELDEIGDSRVLKRPMLVRLWESIRSIGYPKVGTIIFRTDDVSPEDLYPGTEWERIEGKFLMGASDEHEVGEEGGEAEHELTSDELPEHSHDMGNHTHEVGAHAHGLNSHNHGMTHNHNQRGFKNSGREATGYGLVSGGGFTNRVLIDTGLSDGALTQQGGTSTANSAKTATDAAAGNTADSAAFNTGTPSTNETGSTGAGSAFSTLPPYLVVSMWTRTA